MEGELPRMKVSAPVDENSGSLLGDNDSPGQELNYVHVSQLPEDEEYDHQEWTGGTSEKCNLIVNYLPHEIDDITLKTMFVEHGDIAVAKVVKDKLSKKSLGYGFVKFIREEDAIAAIESKNGFLMGHKKLKVSLARPPSTEIRNCKLYITNLPKEFTENEVTDLFSQFGEIIECRVLRDRNSKSNKGVAFVQFNLRIQANNALSLNGYRPPNCDRHLMVKYAEDQHKKKDRRSQLLVGPMASNMMENSYSYEGHMNPDARDPYLYSRGRGSQPGMYRTQQSPAQMNLMSQSQQGNHNFSSSSTANYLSRESGKGASPSMSPSSVSNINSSDWYSQGQMFQGVMYDHQMGNPQAHMSSNQSLNYDQHAMDQHMISQGQRSSHNQGQNQNQGQGTLYMRPNRVTNESGYDGAVAIIISFLPQHADVALLHDLCAPYGRIVSAQIDVDNNSISPEESSALGGCTGRGRVKLSTMSQAQYAAQTLNGAIIFEGGRPLRVVISNSGSSRPTSDPKKAAIGR